MAARGRSGRPAALRAVVAAAVAVAVLAACTPAFARPESANAAPRSAENRSPSSDSESSSLDMYGEPWDETRVAFGSCNKQFKPQPLWPRIVAHRPHAFFWGGDAVYADRALPVLHFWRWTGTVEGIRGDFAHQKARPEYAPMLELARRGMVLDAARDDHDAGTNDANKHSPLLDEAQDAFLDFLDVPASSPRRKRQGMYWARTVGPPGRRVKALLLDIRQHQDRMGVEADILGDDQWAWLERELVRDNDAQLTLIVSGIQVVSTNKVVSEGWKQFPRSKRRLLSLIHRSREETGTAVLVLTGDVHLAEISRTHYCPPDAPGRAMPVYDLTSSGMTHAWGRSAPGVAHFLYGLAANPHEQLDGYYMDLNYATVTVDWTASPSPVVNATIRGEDGLARISMRRTLAELRTMVSSEDDELVAADCRALDNLAYGTGGIYVSAVHTAMALSVWLLVLLPCAVCCGVPLAWCCPCCFCCLRSRRRGARAAKGKKRQ